MSSTSSSSTNISSSVNPEEALYLEEKLETAKSRLERCQKSVKDYSKVMTDLANFSNLPRRQVLTPVCNGLAYFDAVVENTNSLMVLLGDGWFAERSSKQSVEIAGRRLDFLKEEEQMLKGQVRQVEETIKIANEESNINSDQHRRNNTSSYHHDQDHEEEDDDDDDTDSFESCDDLNLREIEDLEEEMLRDTRGGEWSSEVLHQKVRERKEAKRQRRLNEEALAQKTVAEIMMGKAAPKERTEKDPTTRNNSSKVPQHPGEIGIVEQLEMLNDIISKKNNTKKEMDDDDTTNNNNKKDSFTEKNNKETQSEVKSKMTFSHQQPQTDQNQNRNQQLPDLIQPTTSINEDKQNNMNSTTTTTSNTGNNDKETEIMIPLEEFNRRMAEINNNKKPSSNNNNTVADGTGGIVERRTQPVSSTASSNNLTSSSSIVEKQSDATATTAPPKKMSLFKQRKQGL